ncbi:MAG TPA: LacI family DNA-binding transcriptional regulator, partial [Thermomicrobiales bacterium]|nr:LacI family DNA-binding transcriptional regulator [Thermomicrobiales bacterium]
MKHEHGRQPTLNDVARRANVSKQTISRVVNNKGEVSDATRQRVLEAIREIGYHPNALARSLVTSRTHVIGLALPNIDQPFFPQIARGVEDAAAEAGYSVFLCNASGDQERELNAIERLRGHRVAGVISFSSRLSDEAVERAIGGLFPAVMVNRELQGGRDSVIWPGYETGSRLAVEHLLGLGRRRIVFLGLEQDSHVDSIKQAGYESALADAGVSLAPELIVRTSGKLGRSFNELAQGGQAAIAALLEQGVAFDAVFASNDLPAIGAMHHLAASGVRIPDDIAVVGFGGANVAGLVTPTLSTVRIPLYEMGATAFHALLDRINHEHHGERLVNVLPELIVRQSSGGPGQGRVGEERERVV